ncbi:NADH-quinone oxidoreductase subunit NuoF [Thermosediminibacter oceani]|uniref:NAD(P)-dependent iron-only hydrogenase diaphorase component flavoprotein n=1 Tax=Thermosediminibacter oceani (strain ATCC BAA-1034 / DSM 16646 / JW/IW-1228P) TaxID=555079 RepID=D9S238_THEOJ|nr:NADH-quinone oxidoreductase subunit NuoF [Thermosediminibacter oceani]ADL07465.1 NAD(P)-dependent iron-only hydrogenase diaphorase component flavoprotein [Thermosediminibacter oceani DSM 16646]
MEIYRAHVLVCRGTGCTASGSESVMDAFEKEIEKHGLSGEVKVLLTGCLGLCELGPNIIIYPEGTYYCRVKAEDVPEIVEEHLVKGRIVERLLYKERDVEERMRALTDIKFYKRQKRVALRNCGLINPENIEEYIANDGYRALAKVLSEMTPQQVIDEVTRSGLRGRGGGGFPTGKKWQFAKDAPGDVKYVVCNGDEGDPGAFMDRSILEGDPHTVLEAMAIAGYAIGAKEGYIYVRAEYPLAVKRLEIAIEQARERGLLGKNILGTGFEFDIFLRLRSGAFVCGEETALLASIEGRRGEPRPRPPFPAIEGLWGKPTLINNVETFANIPPIILNGADWFASIGTERSKGTKVFAVGGKINNTGLVEIPMGTTLREVIYDIGGGIPNGKKFKAVQTGGPSGGCIPASLLDMPIEYDTLTQAGSMMGSGGMIVMDEDTCMVDIAKFFLTFTQDESCGKCPPCRIGTKRMLEILERITNGEGREGDIELLETLAKNIKASALCGLGQTAPNPVLSTLRYFRDEYEAHIREKKCPAGACKALITYEITVDKCKGCGLCVKVCPAGAITGERKQPHAINREKCIKCNSCFERCRFGAIEKK